MAEKQAGTSPNGILPDHMIGRMIANRQIVMGRDPDHDQIQPASLDLRLGRTAYRVRASFLPGAGRTVQDCLKGFSLHEVDIREGAVLETGCVYIVPLLEALRLPDHLAADTNPKSSTGRLDIFTRVIADRARAFDKIEPGYEGPLYLEISPRTFPILVRTGSRLSQIRFRRGLARLDDTALRDLHAREVLAVGAAPRIDAGLLVSVDLTGFGETVGFRARRHASVIDVDRRDACDVLDFWDVLKPQKGGALILDPNEFYILASKEAVHVPPDHAAEMVPFDPLVGEFRVHYAGFFDPGFGHSAAGGTGSRAVLEVRSREVPFILEDGQTVGRLVYERLAAKPKALYGSGIGSNYQAQGLKLSKHFRAYSG
ncbi:MAG: 2'-deoxycytidine 5'-triphosphate deaminase [Flavobacteriaceae bacterium]